MSKKPLNEVKTNNKAFKPKAFGHFLEQEDGTFAMDLKELRKYSLFIATPCYGGKVDDRYMTSMLNLQRLLGEVGIGYNVTTLRNESLITRARNTLVAMFLATPATHLLFIDSDIEFEAEPVLRMLAYSKGIVTGLYPKKCIPTEYACNFKLEEGSAQINVQNGLVEMLDASTGFMCIKRKVIEEMIKRHPETKYVQDSGLAPELHDNCYALFDCIIDPDSKRYLSEDYTFVRRAQAMGIKTYADINTVLNHCGSHIFTGDLNKMLQREEVDAPVKN